MRVGPTSKMFSPQISLTKRQLQAYYGIGEETDYDCSSSEEADSQKENATNEEKNENELESEKVIIFKIIIF